MANPRMLAKDGTCGDDGCPAVYIEDGQFVIQGPAADVGALQNVRPGETASRISIDVVRQALAAYDREALG
jgi:hypothetical protein